MAHIGHINSCIMVIWIDHDGIFDESGANELQFDINNAHFYGSPSNETFKIKFWKLYFLSVFITSFFLTDPWQKHTGIDNVPKVPLKVSPDAIKWNGQTIWVYQTIPDENDN